MTIFYCCVAVGLLGAVVCAADQNYAGALWALAYVVSNVTLIGVTK
jgi:hypothetical protein